MQGKIVSRAGAAESAWAKAALSGQDLSLLAALRNGDESAFVTLLGRYHGMMVRLADIYVSDRMLAEEVAQEAWLGVLTGLARFEGRSSLKTWILAILIHCAKTRAQREGRSIPFAAVPNLESELDEPAVDPARFFPADHSRWPYHWVSLPNHWSTVPEEGVLWQETRGVVEEAVRALPPHQRAVITLRDVEGLTSDQVCNVLGIAATNQRVLLHRARAKVRRALEQYLDQD